MERARQDEGTEPGQLCGGQDLVIVSGPSTRRQSVLLSTDSRILAEFGGWSRFRIKQREKEENLFLGERSVPGDQLPVDLAMQRVTDLATASRGMSCSSGFLLEAPRS